MCLSKDGYSNLDSVPMLGVAMMIYGRQSEI